jgi:hypothetical protein
VKWSELLVALVPPGVMTVMSTVPAEPLGEVAVIQESVCKVNVAALVPNITEVAPRNPEPLTVTAVPPEEVPVVGETVDTTGMGRKLYSSPKTVEGDPPSTDPPDPPLLPTGVVTTTSTSAADSEAVTAVI